MQPNNSKTANSPHGGGLRGADMRRQSSLFEGRFGRIFRELPAAVHDRNMLIQLGEDMTAEPERDPHNHKLPAAAVETADHIQDDEENPGIDAGYTYFGQFIDHDITFDPVSSLMQQNDPDSLVDYRTPRLDLDSLYGRGPADQPYLYKDNKFRLGSALKYDKKASPSRDLPRFLDTENGDAPTRALIGDKRNDENVIVSQLHGLFMKFHNAMVDKLGKHATFEDAQRMVRWHYQYLVINDYLPRICGLEMVDSILPYRQHESGKSVSDLKPKLDFFHWRNDPFMPLEFSVAAFRFGHSMVRPIYRLNTELDDGEIPGKKATKAERERGLAGRFFIFAGVSHRALNGFGKFPKEWAIDWSLFFDMRGSQTVGGSKRCQPSYKIDTSLTNPLGFLPEFSQTKAIEGMKPPFTIVQMQGKPKDKAHNPANLAVRNLLRGLSLQMPCGQDVARAMGVPVIAHENLRIGKAIVDEWGKAKKLDAAFKDNAPLWYYILAEAHYEWQKRATTNGSKGNEEPVYLGPVGGRIVAETLIGLIYGDGHSYLRQDPKWEPMIGGHGLTMGKMIEFALGI